MGIWNSLEGSCRIVLTAADIPGMLAALNGIGVRLEGLESRDELTAALSVSRRSLSRVREAVERKGGTVRVLSREGIYWRLAALKKRRLLCGGMALLLGLSLYVPSRVLFFQVTGNEHVAQRQILEAAMESGLRFGMSRRAIRSERIKNAMLERLPQLQWVGVNTRGCVAQISVRERTEAIQPEASVFTEGICAAKAGVILSCTATSGNLLCAPGQEVQAGELLISAYTDCGLTVRADCAQGEIFARTWNLLTAVTPEQVWKKGEKWTARKKFSILLGKKRINLWNYSGISPVTCDRIYEEYYVTLPGGFRLPLGLAVETVTEYPVEQMPVSREAADRLLSEFAEDYLCSHMIAGIVEQADTVCLSASGVRRLAGEYVCTEMIGRVQ